MTNRKGTRSYQCSFQTKKRRRREGKTDYKQRTSLIRQDVNKFGAVKSRLVVRKTNSKIICSIHKAFLDGDRVIAYADSTELKRYGINFGLTNYFAAYATGLLVGRKALMSMGLDELYQPNREVGEENNVEDTDVERRPYKVFLDIGLSRSTKGAKVFASMKGASDAGLFIPHGISKFPGFDGEFSLDSSVLRDRIFNKPCVDWMKKLQEGVPEKYNKLFSGYVKLGVNPDSIEGLYEECLTKIIDNPIKPSKEKKDYSEFAKFKVPKLSLEERKRRIAEKLANADK